MPNSALKEYRTTVIALWVMTLQAGNGTEKQLVRLGKRNRDESFAFIAVVDSMISYYSTVQQLLLNNNIVLYDITW